MPFTGVLRGLESPTFGRETQESLWVFRRVLRALNLSDDYVVYEHLFYTLKACRID